MGNRNNNNDHDNNNNVLNGDFYERGLVIGTIKGT